MPSDEVGTSVSSPRSSLGGASSRLSNSHGGTAGVTGSPALFSRTSTQFSSVVSNAYVDSVPPASTTAGSSNDSLLSANTQVVSPLPIGGSNRPESVESQVSPRSAIHIAQPRASQEVSATSSGIVHMDSTPLRFDSMDSEEANAILDPTNGDVKSPPSRDAVRFVQTPDLPQSPSHASFPSTKLQHYNSTSCVFDDHTDLKPATATGLGFDLKLELRYSVDAFSSDQVGTSPVIGSGSLGTAFSKKPSKNLIMRRIPLESIRAVYFVDRKGQPFLFPQQSTSSVATQAVPGSDPNSQESAHLTLLTRQDSADRPSDFPGSPATTCRSAVSPAEADLETTSAATGSPQISSIRLLRFIPRPSTSLSFTAPTASDPPQSQHQNPPQPSPQQSSPQRSPPQSSPFQQSPPNSLPSQQSQPQQSPQQAQPLHPSQQSQSSYFQLLPSTFCVETESRRILLRADRHTDAKVWVSKLIECIGHMRESSLISCPTCASHDGKCNHFPSPAASPSSNHRSVLDLKGQVVRSQSLNTPRMHPQPSAIRQARLADLVLPEDSGVDVVLSRRSSITTQVTASSLPEALSDRDACGSVSNLNRATEPGNDGEMQQGLRHDVAAQAEYEGEDPLQPEQGQQLEQPQGVKRIVRHHLTMPLEVPGVERVGTPGELYTIRDTSSISSIPRRKTLPEIESIASSQRESSPSAGPQADQTGLSQLFAQTQQLRRQQQEHQAQHHTGYRSQGENASRGLCQEPDFTEQVNAFVPGLQVTQLNTSFLPNSGSPEISRTAHPTPHWDNPERDNTGLHSNGAKPRLRAFTASGPSVLVEPNQLKTAPSRSLGAISESKVHIKHLGEKPLQFPDHAHDAVSAVTTAPTPSQSGKSKPGVVDLAEVDDEEDDDSPESRPIETSVLRSTTIGKDRDHPPTIFPSSVPHTPSEFPADRRPRRTSTGENPSPKPPRIPNPVSTVSTMTAQRVAVTFNRAPLPVSSSTSSNASPQVEAKDMIPSVAASPPLTASYAGNESGFIRQYEGEARPPGGYEPTSYSSITQSFYTSPGLAPVPFESVSSSSVSALVTHQVPPTFASKQKLTLEVDPHPSHADSAQKIQPSSARAWPSEVYGSSIQSFTTRMQGLSPQIRQTRAISNARPEDLWKLSNHSVFSNVSSTNECADNSAKDGPVTGGSVAGSDIAPTSPYYQFSSLAANHRRCNSLYGKPLQGFDEAGESDQHGPVTQAAQSSIDNNPVSISVGILGVSQTFVDISIELTPVHSAATRTTVTARYFFLQQQPQLFAANVVQECSLPQSYVPYLADALSERLPEVFQAVTQLHDQFSHISTKIQQSPGSMAHGLSPAQSSIAPPIPARPTHFSLEGSAAESSTRSTGSARCAPTQSPQHTSSVPPPVPSRSPAAPGSPLKRAPLPPSDTSSIMSGATSAENLLNPSSGATLSRASRVLQFKDGKETPDHTETSKGGDSSGHQAGLVLRSSRSSSQSQSQHRPSLSFASQASGSAGSTPRTAPQVPPRANRPIVLVNSSPPIPPRSTSIGVGQTGAAPESATGVQPRPPSMSLSITTGQNTAASPVISPLATDLEPSALKRPTTEQMEGAPGQDEFNSQVSRVLSMFERSEHKLEHKLESKLEHKLQNKLEHKLENKLGNVLGQVAQQMAHLEQLVIQTAHLRAPSSAIFNGYAPPSQLETLASPALTAQPTYEPTVHQEPIGSPLMTMSQVSVPIEASVADASRRGSSSSTLLDGMAQAATAQSALAQRPLYQQPSPITAFSNFTTSPNPASAYGNVPCPTNVPAHLYDASMGSFSQTPGVSLEGPFVAPQDPASSASFAHLSLHLPPLQASQSVPPSAQSSATPLHLQAQQTCIPSISSTFDPQQLAAFSTLTSHTIDTDATMVSASVGRGMQPEPHSMAAVNHQIISECTASQGVRPQAPLQESHASFSQPYSLPHSPQFYQLHNNQPTYSGQLFQGQTDPVSSIQAGDNLPLHSTFGGEHQPNVYSAPLDAHYQRPSCQTEFTHPYSLNSENTRTLPDHMQSEPVHGMIDRPEDQLTETLPAIRCEYSAEGGAPLELPPWLSEGKRRELELTLRAPQHSAPISLPANDEVRSSVFANSTQVFSSVQHGVMPTIFDEVDTSAGPLPPASQIQTQGSSRPRTPQESERTSGDSHNQSDSPNEFDDDPATMELTTADLEALAEMAPLPTRHARSKPAKQ